MSFAISKIAWLLLKPSNALIVLLLLSSLFAASGRRGGKTTLVFAIGCLTGAAILPIGQWLLIPLERPWSSLAPIPPAIDGAIVLGGGFDSRTASPPRRVELGSAADRVTALIALGRRYPDAKLVYSGGVSALTGDRPPGAEQARAFYSQQGFDSQRILFESQSRNTWENALLSRDLAQPKPQETWLLVTSASHMPRAMGVFEKLDWAVTPFPVDFRVPHRPQYGLDLTFDVAARLGELDLAVKEWIGLAAYRLMGRTSSFRPNAMTPED